MAKRNPGRAGRSRKRRPAQRPTQQAAPETEQTSALAQAARKAPTTAKAAKAAGVYKDPMSVGERPQAPWHPLPLSELLILVGAVGTVVAVKRGEVQTGGAALFASIAAVMLGTIEVTLREHLSGYRSHTLLLALLPTIVFHSVVVLVLAAFVQVPRWLTTGMIVLDGGLFAFLFKLLRARFVDARRERTFAAGRR